MYLAQGFVLLWYTGPLKLENQAGLKYLVTHLQLSIQRRDDHRRTKAVVRSGRGI